MRSSRSILLSLFVALAVPPIARAQVAGDVTSKVAALKERIELYRKASGRLQIAAAGQRIPYCVFKDYEPIKKDKTQIGWQTVDSVRKFLSRSSYLDQIVAEASGTVSKQQGVPVKTALFNLFQGMIPLDTDTFRVLRQTREYDRQTLGKFEIFAGGFARIEAEVLQGRAREQVKRLAGTYAFGGLDQLVGYVQRDFSREFAGKRMMNFGTCEGAADQVVETAAQLHAERVALKEIVELLSELAREG